MLVEISPVVLEVAILKNRYYNCAILRLSLLDKILDLKQNFGQMILEKQFV